jgi:ribonuclease P protein component
MTERAQFVRLFDKPSVHRASAFQAFSKPNDGKTARLGITIKGRLSSVWRMRLKRTIREWFRLAREQLGTCDVNIVLRVPDKLDLEYVDRLRRQLREWKS